jgi:hypothetical protein
MGGTAGGNRYAYSLRARREPGAQIDHSRRNIDCAAIQEREGLNPADWLILVWCDERTARVRELGCTAARNRIKIQSPITKFCCAGQDELLRVIDTGAVTFEPLNERRYQSLLFIKSGAGP